MAEANPVECNGENFNEESVEMSSEKLKSPENLDENFSSNRALCINLKCTSGVGLTRAPVFVQTFYNVQYMKNVMHRVCDVCYAAAEDHFIKLREKLVKQEPLIKMESCSLASNSVILDACDAKREEQRLPEDVLQVLRDKFEDVYVATLEKTKFHKVQNISLDVCDKKLCKVEAGLSEYRGLWDEVQKDLDTMRNKLYKPFQVELKFQPPMEIVDSNSTLMLTGNFKVKQQKQPSRILANLLPPTCVIPAESDVLTVNEVNHEGHARPTGPLVIPKLFMGTPVIGCKSACVTSRWERGKIFGTENVDGEIYYRVKFNDVNYTKSLSRKLIAYGEPSKTAYNVATRVVAYYQSLDGQRNNGYYVGIVGEPAKITNNWRYLVFFDAGFPQYVEHDEVFPVMKTSMNVEEDVDQHSREFIAKYIRRYPERPMVRLQVGQNILIQHRHKWVTGKVREVDTSLACISFLVDQCEWIYRGSTRLKPLYDQTHRRHQALPQSVLKQTNRPYVYYEDSEPATNASVNGPPEKSRMVAKKSMRPNPSLPKLAPRLQPHEIVEFKTAGYLRPVIFQERVIGRDFTPHTCNPDCVSWTNYRDYRGRKIAPLVVPLQVGFDRFFHRIKKKIVCVTYSGPCGRMIRNEEEMHRYLKMTRCDLGMELFSFEPDISAGIEFSVPRGQCKYFDEDVSGGAENVVIQCINEISPQAPEPLIYSTVRLPLEGVNINTDPEFRVCCDCTDDCSDKEKCACWQLTLSAPEIIKQLAGESSFGYTYRRLEHPVSTGIYECYTGCSCIKSQCTNRVVQFPLSQKLQLFRTLNKGWGLRTLNDIPTGSLVCIYVGLLMNESRANEDGRKYGDEYFAQIDFIENAEQIKEDFERGVDLEASYDDSDHETDPEGDHEFIPQVPVFGSNRSINTRSKKKKNHDDDNPQSTFTAVEPATPKMPSVRELFGPNEDCYVMDAKKKGNIGRYLNHSCDPNTVVQNVFIDTHDPRFPWVAFFAAKNLKAGTELTWDYGYTLHEDEDRRMYCYCGTSQCRQYLM